MSLKTDKQKIELSYLDGDNMNSYMIQMSQEEYHEFNIEILRNHGRVDVVAVALHKLTENEFCTKHHKNKINEILNKTHIINLRLIDNINC